MCDVSRVAASSCGSLTHRRRFLFHARMSVGLQVAGGVLIGSAHNAHNGGIAFLAVTGCAQKGYGELLPETVFSNYARITSVRRSQSEISIPILQFHAHSRL